MQENGFKKMKRKKFYLPIFETKCWMFYFFVGHLFAHPLTQAPKTRRGSDGQTSMQTSKDPPGQPPMGNEEGDSSFDTIRVINLFF